MKNVFGRPEVGFLGVLRNVRKNSYIWEPAQKNGQTKIINPKCLFVMIKIGKIENVEIQPPKFNWWQVIVLVAVVIILSSNSKEVIWNLIDWLLNRKFSLGFMLFSLLS